MKILALLVFLVLACGVTGCSAPRDPAVRASSGAGGAPPLDAAAIDAHEIANRVARACSGLDALRIDADVTYTWANRAAIRLHVSARHRPTDWVDLHVTDENGNRVYDFETRPGESGEIDFRESNFLTDERSVYRLPREGFMLDQWESRTSSGIVGCMVAL